MSQFQGATVDIIALPLLSLSQNCFRELVYEPQKTTTYIEFSSHFAFEHRHYLPILFTKLQSRWPFDCFQMFNSPTEAEDNRRHPQGTSYVPGTVLIAPCGFLTGNSTK